MQDRAPSPSSETILLENLLNQSEIEFIHQMNKQFPEETKLLCGEMEEAPSLTHEFTGDFSEKDLPSHILFGNSSEYDRIKFVELDRGYAAGISLLYILKGDTESYKKFIRSQDSRFALTFESFKLLHTKCTEHLYTPALKIAAFYTSTFNDVGKNKLLMKAVSVIEHDEANAKVANNPELRRQYLPGLEALPLSVRDLICATLGLDFNPSCFSQGEYPLHPLEIIAKMIQNVPSHLRKKDVFRLLEVTSLADIAGISGHQAFGGKGYIEPVHSSFVTAFNELYALVENNAHAKTVYLNHLHKHATKLNFVTLEDENLQIMLTRIALMIRANGEEDAKTILDAYAVLRDHHPEVLQNLMTEMVHKNLDHDTSSIWMQYSPDLLRILCKQNHSGQTRTEGLVLGLRIYEQALREGRNHVNSFQSCYMVQGRALIDNVKKVIEGKDPHVLEILKKAAEEGLHFENDKVYFQPENIRTQNLKKTQQASIAKSNIFTTSPKASAIASPSNSPASSPKSTSQTTGEPAAQRRSRI